MGSCRCPCVLGETKALGELHQAPAADKGGGLAIPCMGFVHAASVPARPAESAMHAVSQPPTCPDANAWL